MKTDDDRPWSLAAVADAVADKNASFLGEVSGFTTRLAAIARSIPQGYNGARSLAITYGIFKMGGVMSDEKGVTAWVVSASGKNRTFLGYCLKQKRVCVGWGRTGTLCNLMRNDSFLDEDKLAEYLPDDSQGRVVLKSFNEIKEKDLVIIRGTPFVGEISKDPYVYDVQNVIGGWELYHCKKVDQWHRVPFDRFKEFGFKHWKRGILGKAKVDVGKIKRSLRELPQARIEGIQRLYRLDEEEMYVLLKVRPCLLSGKNPELLQAWKKLEATYEKLKSTKGGENEEDCIKKLVLPLLEKCFSRKPLCWEREWLFMDRVLFCKSCRGVRVILEGKRLESNIYESGKSRQITRYLANASVIGLCNCKGKPNVLVLVSNGYQFRVFRPSASKNGDDGNFLEPLVDLNLKTGRVWERAPEWSKVMRKAFEGTCSLEL